MAKERKPVSDISQLVHDKRNPRKHNERNLKVIVNSLHDVGFARSIVIDENNEILAGNGVTEAAVIAGIEKVIEVEADGNTIVAVRRRGLSDEQKQRLKYYDNRSGELAGWDNEQLLADLNEGMDLSAFWNQDELDALLEGMNDTDGGAGTDTEPQVNKADELRQKWGVELSQLWQLGEHRIICGDCTDPAVVARLMGGEKADMVFTDPPYNVDVAGGSHDPRDTKNYRSGGTVENDKMTPAEFLVFLDKVFAQTLSVMNDGASLYVCFSDSEIKNFVNAFCREDIHYAQMVIWKKQQFVFGRKDYHSKHEPILYGWKNGAAHYFIDDRTQDTVWEVDRPMRSEKEHPTQKPVELYEKALTNSSRSGALIYEPFSGSGTVIIACSNLGRKCRAVEISPAYVAVAIERFYQHTGIDPVLID